MTFTKEQLKGLLELQDIDLGLERGRRQLGEATGGAALLPVRERLASAEAVAADVSGGVGELRRALRYSEQEAQSMRTEIATNERKLYGGLVRNPKEADQMQQYVASLRRRLDQEDEKALALMMEIEPLESEVTAAADRVAALGQELRTAQAGLADSVSHLTAEIPRLEAARVAAAAALPPALASKYEGLRARRGAGVVAAVQDSKCDGCRVGLPFVVIREVRSGELRTCDNCGRILVEA